MVRVGRGREAGLEIDRGGTCGIGGEGFGLERFGLERGRRRIWGSRYWGWQPLDRVRRGQTMSLCPPA